MHLRGLAADIQWPVDPLKKWTLLRFAVQRFSGVGVYQTFLHVDLRYLASRNASAWVGNY